MQPCILDIKMGTRQYGDNQDALAIEYLKANIEKTTMSKLGAKIHGMQVSDTR